jgi:hypothetical protein
LVLHDGLMKKGNREVTILIRMSYLHDRKP